MVFCEWGKLAYLKPGNDDSPVYRWHEVIVFMTIRIGRNHPISDLVRTSMSMSSVAKEKMGAL